MNLKFCWLLSPCLLWNIHAHTQTNHQITTSPGHQINASSNPLYIGNIMPDVSVQFININKPASLLQFKNKLIILDFFQTICGACIGSLPHLNVLQQQNTDGLQVILVTDEPVNTVKTFFATNRLAKQNKLPVVINDRRLKTLFPHTLLPHEVWINRDGIIKAITGPGAVTQGNITAMANDKNFSLPLKEDLLDFDAEKPLFDNGNGGSISKIFFRSTFSQAINGVKSKTAVYTSNTCKRYLCLNQSLPGLYQEALNGLAANKIVLELQNPQQAKALYCYELVTPIATSVEAMHEMLQQDIARCFNVRGSYQQQLMLCYTLIRKTNDSLPAPGAGNSIAFEEDSVTFSKPCTTNELVAALNDAAKNASTIFLTGDDVPLPAGVSVDLTSVHTAAGLQQQLLRYGISLMPIKQSINMFVITNPGTTKTIVQNQ